MIFFDGFMSDVVVIKEVFKVDIVIVVVVGEIFVDGVDIIYF